MRANLKSMIISLVSLLVISLPGVSIAQGNQKDTANDQALLNKGLDAPIILSPGRTLDEAKKALRESNRLILSTKLDDQHPEKYLKDSPVPKGGASTPNTSAGTLATTNNSFTGSTTLNGAVLLAQYTSDFSWCTFTTAGYCHGGLYDTLYYTGNINDQVIHTANTLSNTGIDGMQYETPAKWQHYEWVTEMYVEGYDDFTTRSSAVSKGRNYAGDYSLLYSKANNAHWYCSKVPWRAYNDVYSQIDMDHDGGFTVYPNDVYLSTWNYVATVWY